MRVAFVSAVTHHHRETEQALRLRRVATGLAARGHEVTVCCAQWWEGTPESFEEAGVTYRAVTRHPEDVWFGARLPLVLRRLDPDVVHSTGQSAEHVLGARVGGALASAPLVVDWYDPPGADGTAPRWTDRRAVRWPAALVAPSRTVKTELRSLGAAGEDVRVVPNAVEMDLIRETAPADGGDIVYSRDLDEAANLESLLLALAEFRERDWRATIVGDGPERAGYERQARDLRIDDRVEFVGEQSLEERIALFKNAHVYVQTARRCSFATDLLRALACGCVGVVEYHVESSAHELVEREERGFLATDDAAIVERIVEAGDLPRMDVDESFARYDERAVLEHYLDCYRDVQREYGVL